MKTKTTLLAIALNLFGWNISAQVLALGSSNPLLFCSSNGVLFFTANENINSNELWKSDGTIAGTIMVKDINRTGSAINVAGERKIVAMGENVYFTANDGVNGEELWKSNGTEAGTVMVKNIRTGTSSSQIQSIIEFNDAIYFIADDGISGTELWKSNGTGNGTVMVKDILPGQYEGINSSYFKEFVKFNNLLYFVARDNTAGSHTLWKTDGTNAGTTKVITSANSFALYPKYLTEYNGNLYFSAYSNEINGNTSGEELYKSDGTEAGTVLVKDIYPATNKSSYPSNFTVANDLLFFIANDEVHGRELWKTDGSANGTVLVKDIFTGANEGVYYTPSIKMAVANNNLFFAANDGVNGSELWKTDGTAVNTTMIKDIRPGSASSFDSNNGLLAINGTVYFKADNGTLGFELWKSDGTLTGTSLVKDIMPPGYTISSSSSPALFYNHNGVLYFTATNGVNGRELWKYNATLGVNKNYKDDLGITVYPNPSKGIINVALTDLKETELTVYNITGQKVFTKKINEKNSKLDLNKFTKGIYFLNFNNNDGNSVTKIILDK